jgi:hypothetical protein
MKFGSSSLMVDAASVRNTKNVSGREYHKKIFN